MRQPALGRFEWIVDAHRKADERGGKKGSGGAPAKKGAAKAAPKGPSAAG